MSFVFDAGALIALERNDHHVWLALKRAASSSRDVIVPSTVVAQVWRSHAAQARLAKVLEHCVIAPFDGLAREVGALCGRAKTSDICDAHVALVASRAALVLYTSDGGDLRHLLRVIGRGKPQVVHC